MHLGAPSGASSHAWDTRGATGENKSYPPEPIVDGRRPKEAPEEADDHSATDCHRSNHRHASLDRQSIRKQIIRRQCIRRRYIRRRCNHWQCIRRQRTRTQGISGHRCQYPSQLNSRGYLSREHLPGLRRPLPRRPLANTRRPLAGALIEPGAHITGNWACIKLGEILLARVRRNRRFELLTSTVVVAKPLAVDKKLLHFAVGGWR